MERDSQSIESWINSFKIAIINEDIDLINTYIDSIIELDTIEQMQEVQALIKESINLLKSEQLIISQNLQKISNSKKFLDTQIQSRIITLV